MIDWLIRELIDVASERYIDIGNAASVVGGRQAISDRLMKVALEEVAHYVTGATDNSRDFQDYLLDLAVKLARCRSECEVAHGR